MLKFLKFIFSVGVHDRNLGCLRKSKLEARMPKKKQLFLVYGMRGLKGKQVSVPFSIPSFCFLPCRLQCSSAVPKLSSHVKLFPLSSLLLIVITNPCGSRDD